MPLPGGQPISLRMCIGTTSTASVSLSIVHQTANTQGRLGTNVIEVKYILKRKTILNVNLILKKIIMFQKSNGTVVCGFHWVTNHSYYPDNQHWRLLQS